MDTSQPRERPVWVLLCLMALTFGAFLNCWAEWYAVLGTAAPDSAHVVFVKGAEATGYITQDQADWTTYPGHLLFIGGALGLFAMAALERWTRDSPARQQVVPKVVVVATVVIACAVILSFFGVIFMGVHLIALVETGRWTLPCRPDQMSQYRCSVPDHSLRETLIFLGLLIAVSLISDRIKRKRRR